MQYAVDRFEDELVVLQDDNGDSLVVSKTLLPLNVAQGDVLIRRDGAYYRDDNATANRRARIRSLEQVLRNKRKDG